MPYELKRHAVEKILQAERLEDLSIEQIIHGILDERAIFEFIPDSLCQIDPRDGGLIVYNSSRAKRIHTTTSPKADVKAQQEENCPICNGKSTGIIDLAELSEGFTFINKNLYPVFHPLQVINQESMEDSLYLDPFHLGRKSHGFHFLQWTSSVHENDWTNMSLKDCRIVMERLAVLERKLLYESKQFMPLSKPVNPDKQTYGFVSIIKNYGQPAGASLTHSHQQIGYSNIMPTRFFNNWQFSQRHNKLFSQYMLEENPKDLLVKDYGSVVLLVPYFMRRPYYMLMIVKDINKQYLHELSATEMDEVTLCVQESIKAILHVMEAMGKTPSYNITFNNGPGAGLYIEFLPHTQEKGGFEHLGLWVCQADHYQVAAQLRDLLKE